MLGWFFFFLAGGTGKLNIDSFGAEYKHILKNDLFWSGRNLCWGQEFKSQLDNELKHKATMAGMASKGLYLEMA